MKNMCRTSKRISLVGVLIVAALMARRATANVIYDFSLQDGDAGAVKIDLTFPTFQQPGGLDIVGLSDPSVNYTSANALDPSFSVVGFQVTPTATLIGLALTNAADTGIVYFTQNYPDDFFSFTRGPLDTGVFKGIGNVVSDYNLNTSSPTATLTVSGGSSSVPEPRSLILCGLGLLGLGAVSWRYRSGLSIPMGLSPATGC